MDQIVKYWAGKWSRYQAMTEEQRAKVSDFSRQNAQFSFMNALGRWISEHEGYAIHLATIGQKTESSVVHHNAHNTLINLGSTLHQLNGGAQPYLCACCGKPCLTGSYSNKPDTRYLCFHCDHWLTILARLEKPMEYGKKYSVLTSEGQLLSFEEGIVSGNFLGFGGSLWHFKLTENDYVRSNNVWSGGYVPYELRPRLQHRVVEIVSEFVYAEAKHARS